MKPVKLITTEAHRSAYTEPIAFSKGTILTIGERYDGAEGWNDWYMCSAPGQEAGWVPAQLFDRINDNIGIANEDYSANELDVDAGESVIGKKEMNGWIWCARTVRSEEGWVPSAKLCPMDNSGEAER